MWCEASCCRPDQRPLVQIVTELHQGEEMGTMSSSSILPVNRAAQFQLNIFIVAFQRDCLLDRQVGSHGIRVK